MGVEICSEELAGKVVAGVDTHADTHWLCMLDEERRVALSREFPADAAGIAALAMLGAEAGDVSTWFGETTRLFEQGGDISLAALRGVGIAVTAELGAQLCTDAGESAMAGRITLAGRVAMLSLCLPMLTELARVAEELLA